MLFCSHGGDAIESVLFWLVGVPCLLLIALLTLMFIPFKSKKSLKNNNEKDK